MLHYSFIEYCSISVIFWFNVPHIFTKTPQARLVPVDKQHTWLHGVCTTHESFYLPNTCKKFRLNPLNGQCQCCRVHTRNIAFCHVVIKEIWVGCRFSNPIHCKVFFIVPTLIFVEISALNSDIIQGDCSNLPCEMIADNEWSNSFNVCLWYRTLVS